jgi:hypothetical protein
MLVEDIRYVRIRPMREGMGVAEREDCWLTANRSASATLHVLRQRLSTYGIKIKGFDPVEGRR